MKKLLFVVLPIFIIGFSTTISAQTQKIDTSTQLTKEDPYNMYQVENTNPVDILEALDFAGIQIKKFQIGTFNQPYKLLVFAEEFVNGEVIKTDTLLAWNNKYYFPGEGKAFHYDFIDQIKILAKTTDNHSTLMLKTYGISTRKDIELVKTHETQFFNWRDFKKTTWELDKKIPLTIFASSWFDKAIDQHRFCGTVNLEAGAKDTDELLSFIPNYVLISYQIIAEEGL